MANINRELNDIKNAVYGKDVRKSIHDGIDKVNKESEGSRAIANNTDNRQNAIEQQFDDLQQNYTEGSPSTAEVVAARTNTKTNENYSTIGRRMDDEYQDVKSQLAQRVTKEQVYTDRRSLVSNYNFEELPLIQSRSDVYGFEADITNPSHLGKKSLKIISSNYESSTDPQKDFAFVLTEKMVSTDKLLVSFWAYPTKSNKSLNMRMAFSGGTTVSLGEAYKWNKINVEINLSDMTQNNSWFYFDLLSSYTLYISDLQVHSKKSQDIVTATIPNSFNAVHEKIIENPTSIHNSTGIIDRMIKVGQSYMDKLSEFEYGMSYTAYDEEVRTPNGKFRVDCSTFASLMIKGVPFEQSRYNGNTENITDPLFFNNINPYKWRYANQMAKYAFDKGYAFTPNKDFSNVEPGDVLFFSWDSYDENNTTDLAGDVRENSFMKIDHVGVFLHKKMDDKWSTLQVNNSTTTVFVDATDHYMSQCVLVARFPFSNVESFYGEENLIINGGEKRSSTNGYLGIYNLAKPLQKGNYYTLVFDVDLLSDDSYITVQSNQNETIYTDYGRNAIEYKDVVVVRFPYLLNHTTHHLNVFVSGGNRYGEMNWLSLFEGYKRNKKEFITTYGVVRDFILRGELIPELNENAVPYYKYSMEGNKLHLALSLPFTTTRTGELELGTLRTSDRPSKTQRIPCSMADSSGSPVNGILQVSETGIVSVIPYSGLHEWNRVLVNGVIFR